MRNLVDFVRRGSTVYQMTLKRSCDEKKKRDLNELKITYLLDSTYPSPP